MFLDVDRLLRLGLLLGEGAAGRPRDLDLGFVGGFVYLVASMRPGAGDDYDDGAVL